MVKIRSAQKNQGFTIIEVMFVLAIAGVIALMIFKAIPALTRNSRNGERQNGVASVLRAVSHYELNNSGAMPVPCSGATCFGANTFTDQQKLIYYDNVATTTIYVCNGSYSSGALSYGASPCTAPPAVTNVDKVYVYNYLRCNGNSFTITGAGYSDVAALYAVENSSSIGISQCKQL